MLSSQPNIINSATLPRHAAQDEAARLKAEILQQGNELANLERLAGSVHATRLDSWPRSDTLTSSNGSRSISTGRIIEQLQRDIDHLRLTTQASTISYESERRAREALRIKCDDLELSITTLRAESQAHATTLQRSDKALHDAKETIRTLQTSLMQATQQNSELERDRQQQSEHIMELERQVQEERQGRQMADEQYCALTDEFTKLQSTCHASLSDLRQELCDFMTRFKEEQVQVRTAKEDIILFNEQAQVQTKALEAAREKLVALREQQATLMQAGTNELKVKLNHVNQVLEAKSDSVEGLQSQLRQLQDSLRVVKS